MMLLMVVIGLWAKRDGSWSLGRATGFLVVGLMGVIMASYAVVALREELEPEDLRLMLGIWVASTLMAVLPDTAFGLGGLGLQLAFIVAASFIGALFGHYKRRW